MPYRSTGDGQMEFSGKIAYWMQDFQKWYLSDYGSGSNISLLTYVQYATIIYSGLAKGKWQDGFLTKSKAKTLDTFLSIDQSGTYIVETYPCLDFLAENLTNEERDKWAQHCRNEILKLLKTKAN